MSRILERLFRFFASLKLAVLIILALASISAVGTFVEAQYDAQYAQKMVYHSPLMYMVLGLLCVNLLSVMIDRLPWQQRHAPFLLAHIGIISLLVGSLVTRLIGVDGSLPIDIGKSNRYVILPETQFSVFGSFGSGEYTLLARSDQDFLRHHPRKQKNPVELDVGSEKLTIKDYYHYSLRTETIVPSSEPKAAAALRINLQNANVNLTEWLVEDPQNEQTTLELGPAKVIFGRSEPKYTGANVIQFTKSESADVLNYFVFTKSKGGLTKRGTIRAGESIEVGWMGLQLRVFSYLPKAERKLQFVDNGEPNANTMAAVNFHFRGRDHWLALNSSVRIFNDDSLYLFVFGNKRLDLGFDIHLKNFSVGRYQGTMRAASYASDVEIPGVLEYHISMNEPLKHAGYTFYQASFEEESIGQPKTSILSVNKDPGRWIKYFGSLCIVLGSILLFYFKRKGFRFYSPRKDQ